MAFMSMGLERCPFIPASSAWRTSSAKALAVMATMGIFAARGWLLARKARFSQHTLTEEELNLLRGLVDRERSHLCAAPGLIRQLARRYWWGRPKGPVPPKQGE